MHIGISSPISIQKFIDYLSPESQRIASQLHGLKAPAVDTLVQGFLFNNHSVSIYTLSFEVEEKVLLTGPKIDIHVNPLRRQGWQRAVSLFYTESHQIKKNIEEQVKKPDILHAHWTYEYAMGIMSFRKEIPVVVTVRDWAPKILDLHRNYYRFSRLILNNFIFQFNPVQLISNSVYIQKQIQKTWSIESKYLPNPISSEFIEKKNSKIKPKNRIISISNNLGKGKNIEKLLQAFHLVKQEQPTLELYLVGLPFVENNSSIQMWKKRGLLENVILKGSVDHSELIELYDQSTFMVHPSLEESFGNTLIEAMARKVPVIGGERSGAVPFLLNKGKTGHLCDVKSISSIKDAILFLLNNPEQRELLATVAHEQVLKEFSEEIVVKKTLLLYKTILDKE